MNEINNIALNNYISNNIVQGEINTDNIIYFTIHNFYKTIILNHN